MRRIVLVASLIGLATPAVTSAELPAQQHGRGGCPRVFDLGPSEKIAHRLYAGTRTVSLRELRVMGHREACQRAPGDGAVLRHYDRHQAALHAKRVARAARRTTISTGAMSALEKCIINAESGGNSQAVNGVHEGIGQWSPDAWRLDGGLRYASTPLGASYAQQEIVLRGEGIAGMEAQQAAFDPC